MISVYSFQFYLEINSLNDLKKLDAGDWASGNPQSPIPNPQSQIP
jgi:hypothetical protein